MGVNNTLHWPVDAEDVSYRQNDVILAKLSTMTKKKKLANKGKAHCPTLTIPGYLTTQEISPRQRELFPFGQGALLFLHSATAIVKGFLNLSERVYLNNYLLHLLETILEYTQYLNVIYFEYLSLSQGEISADSSCHLKFELNQRLLSLSHMWFSQSVIFGPDLW